jgi:FixJ family two-component response regulator
MPHSSNSEPRRFWTARQSRTQAIRPVAYVTMQDAGARAEVFSILERAGWAVIPQPTGFHLLQSIADVVEGSCRWLDPMLIVIDAYARGCSGATIAAGLRELGVKIPIVLVTTAGQRVAVTTDDALSIADTSDVPGVVEKLAAAHSRAQERGGNTANEIACHNGAKPSPGESKCAPEPSRFS